jgi:hypothetical protein
MPHVAHVGHSRFVYAVAQRTERIDPSPVRCCVKALALRASYLGDDAVGDIQQTAFEPVGKALFLPESPAAVWSRRAICLKETWMKKTLMGLAILPFLAGTVLAGQPLTDKQMGQCHRRARLSGLGVDQLDFCLNSH